MRAGLQPDKNLEDLILMSSPLQALPLFSNLSCQNQYVTSQWHLWVMGPLARVCERPHCQMAKPSLGSASPPSLQAPGMRIALLTQGDCPPDRTDETSSLEAPAHLRSAVRGGPLGM